MALSNIFREPRREITESVVGLVVFGAFAWADYYVARWFQDVTGGWHDGCPWPIGMMLGLLVGFLAMCLLIITHGIGDGICNALQRRGIHLRPRQRR